MRVQGTCLRRVSPETSPRPSAPQYALGVRARKRTHPAGRWASKLPKAAYLAVLLLLPALQACSEPLSEADRALESKISGKVLVGRNPGEIHDFQEDEHFRQDKSWRRVRSSASEGSWYIENGQICVTLANDDWFGPTATCRTVTFDGSTAEMVRLEMDQVITYDIVEKSAVRLRP